MNYKIKNKKLVYNLKQINRFYHAKIQKNPHIIIRKYNTTPEGTNERTVIQTDDVRRY